MGECCNQGVRLAVQVACQMAHLGGCCILLRVQTTACNPAGLVALLLS